MFRVIIYSNFKINGHNLARFQNSLKIHLACWDIFFLLVEFFFLEFSENNGKSELSDFTPIFTEFSEKWKEPGQRLNMTS